MPSDLQIFIFLLLGWVLCIALGWQLAKYREPVLRCPYDKCLHNENGICTHKAVELDVCLLDDHREGLICKNFAKKQEGWNDF